MSTTKFIESKYKNTGSLFLANMNANLGTFNCGWVMATVNVLSIYFQYEMQVIKRGSDGVPILDSNGQPIVLGYTSMLMSWDTVTSLWNGVPQLGGLVGAFFAGDIANKLGRRKTMILIDVIMIIGSLIQLVDNFWSILIGRIIVGIGVGGCNAVIPLYVNEITPLQITGKMGSIFQVMWNVGYIVLFIVALGVPCSKNTLGQLGYTDSGFLQFYWRLILTIIPAILCLIQILILTFIYTFETPYYLLQQNKQEEAQAIKEKFYKAEYVQESMDAEKWKLENVASDETYSILFSKKYIKPMICAILLPLFMQWSGINSMIFYSNSIFNNIDNNSCKTSQYLSIVVSLVLTIAPLSSGIMFIDRFGRKTCLLIGSALMVLTLYMAGAMVYENLMVPTLVVIFVYLFAFGISCGPVVWLVLPELVPAKGIGIACASNWFNTALVGLLFPYGQKLGLYTCFFFFCICCIVGLIFQYFMVIETKGKTFQQVLDEYNSNRSVYSENAQLVKIDSNQKL